MCHTFLGMWWHNLPMLPTWVICSPTTVLCFICKMPLSFTLQSLFPLEHVHSASLGLRKEKHPKMLILSIRLLLTLALGSPPKSPKRGQQLLPWTDPPTRVPSGWTHREWTILPSPPPKGNGEQKRGISSSSGISLETISITARPCSLQFQVTLTFTKLPFSQRHYWNYSTSCKLHQICVLLTMLSCFANNVCIFPNCLLNMSRGC